MGYMTDQTYSSSQELSFITRRRQTVKDSQVLIEIMQRISDCEPKLGILALSGLTPIITNMTVDAREIARSSAFIQEKVKLPCILWMGQPATPEQLSKQVYDCWLLYLYQATQ